MAEYWVSKKQYWCKYCNIWVRDDAPSRRLHETGMKHQGQKERFIRELYKGGERDKREKEKQAREYARIESAARAAHSKDGGSYTGRLHHSAAASSSRIRPKESKDKWSNYSTAAQMGFDVDESKDSAYAIEQMVRGRDTKIGAWQEVQAAPPAVSYDADGVPIIGEKRKVEDEEDEETEGFKFQHRDKRPVRDPYDEDDFDVSALGGLKFKSKGKERAEEHETVKMEGEDKPDVKPSFKPLFKTEVNGEVKVENGHGEDVAPPQDTEVEVKPDIDTKPKLEPLVDAPAPAAAVAAPETAAPAPASGLFKKRRPPPSGRKK